MILSIKYRQGGGRIVGDFVYNARRGARNDRIHRNIAGCEERHHFIVGQAPEEIGTDAEALGVPLEFVLMRSVTHDDEP
ncbi:hypothetical protein BJF81_14655 [Ornithinimicrobium sp. CNJ-824]|nr:hypothetical protein BJF81_14655 [Ornithinimicrobium sp. CNJ-824]